MLLIYKILLMGKKKLFLVFVFSIHQYIYFFCLWLLCLLVFLICTVLAIFFSYITIVVNLYDIVHGKNNQLYNYFFFWFLCLQHISVFFFFWFLCLLDGVFNLYSTGYFFPIYVQYCLWKK